MGGRDRKIRITCDIISSSDALVVCRDVSEIRVRRKKVTGNTDLVPVRLKRIEFTMSGLDKHNCSVDKLYSNLYL